MIESDHVCVQSLAREAGGDGAELGRQRGKPRPAPPGAVGLVSDKRMPERRHVYPDLVGAAGGEPAFDERGSLPDAVQHAVACDRRFSAAFDDRRAAAEVGDGEALDVDVQR